MKRILPIGLAAVAMASAGQGRAAQSLTPPDSFDRGLFAEAFNPHRFFAGELRSNSDDQLILAVAASARDDYAPSYGLAVAYRCLPNTSSDQRRCSMYARLLRVDAAGGGLFPLGRPPRGGWGGTRSPEELDAALDEAGLDWLEADVAECEGGIFAMDSIRVADWRPDIHYTLQALEDRQVIMHPAMMRVTMSGSYATSTYQGWVLSPGVP